METAISIKGVSKRFGRIQALDTVGFDVPLRSIFGLVGPNGAGKTTLFSVMANFLKADGGQVEVLGIDTRRIGELRGRLTIFPQDAQFQRNVPILDQLAFFRRLDGRTRQQAEQEVIETLQLVGLEAMAKRRVGTLSHGMIKRLGIAQAFLGHPEVILLDEPTAGLDPANARQLRDLVKRLQERATIMVSSHNLAEVQELCDHLAILHQGKLIRADAMDKITQSGREYDLVLSRPLQEREVKQLRRLAGVRDIQAVAANGAGTAGELAGYRVTFDFSADHADPDVIRGALFRSLLDAGISPRQFGEGRSLEARFLEMTGGVQAGGIADQEGTS